MRTFLTLAAPVLANSGVKYRADRKREKQEPVTEVALHALIDALPCGN